MNTVEVYCRTPATKPQGWKKKHGYHGITKDGGIMLPADVSNNPHAVLCASFDGEPMVKAGSGNGVSILLRSEWLKSEYPRVAGTVDLICGKIRQEHGLE
jgi:hypothetical protein